MARGRARRRRISELLLDVLVAPQAASVDVEVTRRDRCPLSSDRCQLTDRVLGDGRHCTSAGVGCPRTIGDPEGARSPRYRPAPTTHARSLPSASVHSSNAGSSVSEHDLHGAAERLDRGRAARSRGSRSKSTKGSSSRIGRISSSPPARRAARRVERYQVTSSTRCSIGHRGLLLHVFGLLLGSLRLFGHQRLVGLGDLLEAGGDAADLGLGPEQLGLGPGERGHLGERFLDLVRVGQRGELLDQVGPLGQQRVAPLERRLLLAEPAVGEGDERRGVGGDVLQHEPHLGQGDAQLGGGVRGALPTGPPRRLAPRPRRPASPRRSATIRASSASAAARAAWASASSVGLVARADGARREDEGGVRGEPELLEQVLLGGAGLVDLAPAPPEAVAVVRLHDLGVGRLEGLDQLGPVERVPLRSLPRRERPAGLGHPQPTGHHDRVGILLERGGGEVALRRLGRGGLGFGEGVPDEEVLAGAREGVGRCVLTPLGFGRLPSASSSAPVDRVRVDRATGDVATSNAASTVPGSIGSSGSRARSISSMRVWMASRGRPAPPRARPARPAAPGSRTTSPSAPTSGSPPCTTCHSRRVRPHSSVASRTRARADSSRSSRRSRS